MEFIDKLLAQRNAPSLLRAWAALLEEPDEPDPDGDGIDGPEKLRDVVADSVRRRIALSLEQYNGNVADAARALGISRYTLYRHMGRFKLRPSGQ